MSEYLHLFSKQKIQQTVTVWKSLSLSDFTVPMVYIVNFLILHAQWKLYSQKSFQMQLNMCRRTLFCDRLTMFCWAQHAINHSQAVDWEEIFLFYCVSRVAQKKILNIKFSTLLLVLTLTHAWHHHYHNENFMRYCAIFQCMNSEYIY